MNDLELKLQLIRTIFSQTVEEKAEKELQEGEKPGLFHALQHGKYYGGVYNNKKYMYSEKLIKTLPIEKLETFVKKQIGYEKIT